MIPEPLFIILLFLKTWWWLILPFFLYVICEGLYLSWLRWEVWYKEQKWAVLEIIPPAEIEKPFRAMEYVCASLWAIYGSADWKGKWCEGVLPYGPYWFSFEIVSLEGEIHFYLRLPQGHRQYAETLIHTHYPEAEVLEAEDYTQKIPQDIPNNTYDLKGEDYVFLKDNSYPIKTYKFFEVGAYKFFETGAGEQEEAEKKVDPLPLLMEGLDRLKKGEQFWFQLVAAPITNKDIPWQNEAQKIVDVLAKRTEPIKKTSILQDPLDVIKEFIILVRETAKTIIYDVILGLFFPPSLEEKAAEKKPSSVITPGEDIVIKAIEEKIAKPAFRSYLRALYIFKKDAYNPANAALVKNYLANFRAENLNALVSWSKTKPSIEYFFKERRIYLRKKLLFEKYVKRFPPLYPQIIGKETIILNIEELATIFHFPALAGFLPPGVPRVSAKKGAPPPGIPME